MFTVTDRLVAFHTILSPDKINPNVAAMPYIIGHLLSHGVGSLIVPKGKYYFGKETIARGYIPYFTDDETNPLAVDPARPVEARVGAGSMIRAVRSRVKTPVGLCGVVPVVNDRALRAIDRSKAAHARLLGPWMPETVAIPPHTSVRDEMLDRIPGDKLALKVDNGRSSRGIRLDVSKQDASGTLEELRMALGPKAAEKAVVMQPMMRGVPVKGLRATDPDQQPLIAHADPNGNHELRVLCFSDRRELRPRAIYRVNAGSADNMWVPIRQESVPPAMFAAAGVGVRAVLEASGSPGGLLAIDTFYGEQSGRVMIREINGSDPGLGGMVTNNRLEQQAHGVLMAHQLIALAQ